MRRLFILTLAFMGVIALSACSTVLNTTSQEIELKTTPPNAKITVDGKKFGVSPQIVNLDRGNNHIVKFELEGYQPYETQLTRKISFWFWGNALNGFIPGMIIDMFTGGMYNLLPEKIETELQVQPPPEKSKKR